MSPIFFAEALRYIQNRSMAELLKLLDSSNGIDLNTRDKFDFALIDYAVLHNDRHMTRALLQYDLNPFNADAGGRTALMRASGLGFSSCVVEFIHARANVDCVDRHGKTATIIATISGHVACLERLLFNRNDVRVIDRFGKNAMYYAKQYKQTACVPVLEVFENQFVFIPASTKPVATEAVSPLKDNSAQPGFGIASDASLANFSIVNSDGVDVSKTNRTIN